MRVPGLLIAVLLLGFSTVALGQASDSLQDSASSAAPLNDSWRMFHKQRPDLDLFRTEDLANQRDRVCFTMRTYKVAREHPHSDVTRIVGYTTCPEANWKLQFRSTDADIEPSTQK